MSCLDRTQSNCQLLGMMLLEGSFISIVGNQSKRWFISVVSLISCTCMIYVGGNFYPKFTKIFPMVPLFSNTLILVQIILSVSTIVIRLMLHVWGLQLFLNLQRCAIDNRPRLLCMFVFLLSCVVHFLSLWRIRIIYYLDCSGVR